MSAPTKPAADLARIEKTTAEQIFAIESKLARLTRARADRIKALTRTRSDLAAAILAGPVAPARHETTY